ncbi:RTA1 like protein-domain-containing protein [Xylariales sp. PMI_506]|nr:RTA1 like protein-domain-containing protein [Xylariales sp. PMI_506]
MVRRCTEVSASCPVQATVLGYYPNLGVNAFLAAAFGLCLIGLLIGGIWKRTWGYSAALVAGCALELAGYVARVQLHANPWNQSAFETQICAIILAPTLICISIYLTLKHAVLSLNPSLSRIRPRLYPAIFVPADVSCLILQAIGGGIAASAGSQSQNPKLLLAGDRVIIVGIALQVVVLLSFGLMAADYFRRAAPWLRSPEADPAAAALWRDRNFRFFFYAVSGAYSGILIRCIYRIAEMSGGWGSTIMRDQPSFIVLEGFMILIPVILLTMFTPGFLFPAMAERESRRFRKKEPQAASAEAAEQSGKGDIGVTSGDETPNATAETEKTA